MKRLLSWLVLLTAALSFAASVQSAEPQAVKEEVFSGIHDVTLKLRMEGPYTADVPLQVVCYFKYSPEAVAKMKGAPVELDKEIGGIIAAVRKRGEFVGNPLETLLIQSPEGTIKAKALLLIGLGEEPSLSLDLMEGVGRTALREAARLGVDRVAFAPLIRDQGNSSLDVGEVERFVIRGALTAYDTEKRLQNQGLAKPYVLKEWIVEAGPAFFDTTKAGLQAAIAESRAIVEKRPTTAYRTIE